MRWARSEGRLAPTSPPALHSGEDLAGGMDATRGAGVSVLKKLVQGTKDKDQIENSRVLLRDLSPAIISSIPYENPPRKRDFRLLPPLAIPREKAGVRVCATPPRRCGGRPRFAGNAAGTRWAGCRCRERPSPGVSGEGVKDTVSTDLSYIGRVLRDRLRARDRLATPDTAPSSIHYPCSLNFYPV